MAGEVKITYKIGRGIDPLKWQILRESYRLTGRRLKGPVVNEAD